MAVFDLDGHTGHERAALMAESSPVVKIAFSSRSIEMWFLLHFGQYQNVFQKVHCRVPKKDRIKAKEEHCTVSKPCLNDGKGECLIGFIRRNTRLSDYDKGMDYFDMLKPFLRDAIFNAEWLRSQYPLQQEYYLRNPYTTMDFLVRRLLNWISLGDMIEINNFQITVRQVQPLIVLEMKNIGKSSQIVQKQHFAFEDSNIQFDFTGNGLLGINESREIKITPLSPIQNTKIKYPAANIERFVWILC